MEIDKAGIEAAIVRQVADEFIGDEELISRVRTATNERESNHRYGCRTDYRNVIVFEEAADEARIHGCVVFENEQWQ